MVGAVKNHQVAKACQGYGVAKSRQIEVPGGREIRGAHVEPARYLAADGLIEIKGNDRNSRAFRDDTGDPIADVRRFAVLVGVVEGDQFVGALREVDTFIVEAFPGVDGAAGDEVVVFPRAALGKNGNGGG